ncbi:hypothetical protein NDU88_005345 [Pleurodeles waltl]|uniref:Uncharacterized protein n=1 Tax=Pleurodeles waltl TaxID=8319 RepID=A0AAV7V3R2_PLEWA|nr:hypothetical protein NDU88_005345 [Pleurodeles waltl]
MLDELRSLLTKLTVVRGKEEIALNRQTSWAVLKVNSPTACGVASPESGGSPYRRGVERRDRLRSSRTKCESSSLGWPRAAQEVKSPAACGVAYRRGVESQDRQFVASRPDVQAVSAAACGVASPVSGGPPLQVGVGIRSRKLLCVFAGPPDVRAQLF